VALRILVVDDDMHERRSLALGLRIAGFSAVEAQSGADALTLLETRTFDLVITDLVMAGLSGVQLARLLHERFPDLPVVLTSGYELGRRQIERAGLSLLAFVPKPYDLADLTGFLHEKFARLATG